MKRSYWYDLVDPTKNGITIRIYCKDEKGIHYNSKLPWATLIDEDPYYYNLNELSISKLLHMNNLNKIENIPFLREYLVEIIHGRLY